MAGTALRGRLTWQLAEFVKAVAEPLIDMEHGYASELGPNLD